MPRRNRNTRRSSLTLQNIQRSVNAQRFNGAGRYGTGAGGRYVSERRRQGNRNVATNSGRRNQRLGNREMKRQDLRSAFLSSDFEAYARRHGVEMGVGRVASKG